MANQLYWDVWSSVSEGVSAPGGNLTVVSSGPLPNRFTLFLADPRGGVYTTSGNPRTGWNAWSSVSEGRTLSGARVGAVELWSSPGSFVVALADPSGGVYATFKNARGGWAPWSSVSEGLTTPGASITAVEHFVPEGRVSLFLADRTGGVYTTMGIRNKWSPWSSVSEGRTIPGGPVTAVQMDSGRKSARTRFAVFLTDPGGGVYTTFGNSVEGWALWSEVPGIRIAPGAPVTALSYGQGDFLLAVSHPDGSVRTTIGNATTGWRPWSSAPENRAVSGSRVGILNRFNDGLTLVIVDSSGEVFYSHNLFNTPGGWEQWLSVSQGSSLPGAPVAISNIEETKGEFGRTHFRAHLFIADRTGGVYSTTTGDPPPPAAPANLRVVSVADRRISMSWNDRSDNELDFRIRYKGTRTGGYADHDGSQTVGPNATSVVLTGLRSGYTYAISVIATNSGGSSSRSNEVRVTTPSRHIRVSSEGAGQNSIFTIAGEGFTPNSHVVLRIASAPFQFLDFPETVGSDGKFSSRHAVRCISGGQLTFTAFEDEDPLGTLANSIVTACP